MGIGQSKRDTRKRPAGAPASESNCEIPKAGSPRNVNRRRSNRQSQTLVSPAVTHGGHATRARKEISYVELLKRPGQTLGLIVSGGADKEFPVKVERLRPGGIAEKSESLEVGDRILAINGTTTDNLTHAEAVALLRDAGDTVTLEVEYETTADGPSQDEGVITKTVLVCLKRESNMFGFTFSGGAEKGRPLTISNVYPGTAAHRNGTIRPGDRILKVNGMNLEHVTHAEAVALLKTAEQNITLELEYDVTIHEEMEDICGPILVEIQKPVGGSLGITLTGSQIPGEPIFISHIKDAGIADRCGALHIGDQVLSINGQSLTQCTLPHAVRLLINSSTPLRLELLPCSQLPPGNSEMVPPQLNVGNNRQGHQPDGAPSSSQMVRQRSVNSATGIGTGTLTRNHSRRQSVGSMQGSLFAVTSPVHLCHTEQLHVDLTPDSFGYGFMIKGIVEASVGPFVVTSIESDSPAQQHGEFMIGDRIMFINGRCTEAMPLEQAWNIVNEATESLALETEFDVAESVIPGTGTFDVKLVKQSGALGITINGHDEKGGPIWISQVKKGGVAHRTGTLEPGDVLLAVDGKSLKGATLHHAVKLLKTTADIVTLQISKDAATLGPPGSIVFAVELVRRGASLGITVHGSDNPGDPIIVSYLKEDGVAFRSATLKIGDRILAINNVNLRMHTLADAVKLLQNAGDVVTLKICREPNIAPDRGTQSLPADPCSQPLDRPLYSHGDVNEFTCPPGDYRDSSLSPQPHTLPRISHSPSSDRALQRLLAMLALKQSGQSTPDMQSLAGSPEYNRMFETHPWSKSEALHKNFLIPDINLPSDDGSDHSLHAQLANSGDHHVGNSGNCSASDTNHSLSHTLPKQATKWVGHSDQTSHSLINSTQDGYATWGGRKQTVPTAMAGTLNQGVDEIREKGFGELKPLNHALEQAVSRQQRLAVKDTSSDSDSPSVISKARGGKPPPKPRRRFDKHIKAFAYMPTSVFVKKVVLQRKSSVSDFGFSVADGATEPGVFVKAVRADGPAMDKLKAFDKILQVNDVNVHDSDCCRVVPLIAQAGHLLSLIITRRKQAHKVDAESKGSTS